MARPLSVLGTGLLLLALGSISANAQIFQAVYGGAADDGARGGVLTVTSVPPNLPRGFISVGEENSFGVNTDVYVVRTDMAGNLVWSRSYDIGGFDVGRKIAQTRDNGFIITGITEDSTNCCFHNNIFLLKIDAFGNPQWTRTYGGSGKEEGMDVRQTLEPVGPTIREFFYVAGRMTSVSNGDYDGYLMKTDDQGDLVWGRVYGDAQTDYFNGLFIARGGDVIATGATNSYTNNGDLDIFVARVSGVDGSMSGPSHWMAHYGSGRNEDSWRIIELQNSSQFASELVIVGYTQGYSQNTAALLLKLKGSGAFLTSRVEFDPFSNGWCEFTDVKETPTSITPTAVGNIVVTGRFENNTSGFGRFDLYLGEFSAANCFPLFWESLHGRGDNDEGWGVDVAPGNPNSPPFSVVATGATRSFSAFGFEELYLVRANRGGRTGCFDAQVTETNFCPNFPETYVRPCHPLVDLVCKAPVQVQQNFNFFILCVGPGAAQSGDGQGTEGILGGANGDDAVKGGSDAQAVAAIDDAAKLTGALAAQPNPVRKGDVVNLVHPGTTEKAIHVTISDINGNVVYEKTLEGSVEQGSIPVGTEGWASGSYLIKVTAGDRSESHQFKIID